MNKALNIEGLKGRAKAIRRDILRMLERAGSGHTGGSLSMVELLLVLYNCILRHNPKDPAWKKRDRFILSKGHGCPALYAVLADCGYFPKKELLTLRELGSRLQGHPQLGLPGLEVSSGSLGQGLSVSNGIALGLRLDKIPARVYCMLGDGESQEGQVWEAALSSAHYKLDTLCAVIDYNKLQIDGLVCEVKNIEPFGDKWRSFGWNVIEADGHDIAAIKEAFDEAAECEGRPSVIIAHTIKGKGVSFMENECRWHGIAPKKEELERALKELE